MKLAVGTSVSSTSALACPAKMYICMRGGMPSDGVDMSALSMPEKSCPSASIASSFNPPRP